MYHSSSLRQSSRMVSSTRGREDASQRVVTCDGAFLARMLGGVSQAEQVVDDATVHLTNRQS